MPALTRLRKFLGIAEKGHALHAPFHVTTHHGHTVQTFESLELAIEAAETLGPDHYIVDRHGMQIGPRKENCCVVRNSHTRHARPYPPLRSRLQSRDLADRLR